MRLLEVAAKCAKYDRIHGFGSGATAAVFHFFAHQPDKAIRELRESFSKPPYFRRISAGVTESAGKAWSLPHWLEANAREGNTGGSEREEAKEIGKRIGSEQDLIDAFERQGKERPTLKAFCFLSEPFNPESLLCLLDDSEVMVSGCHSQVAVYRNAGNQ